MRDDARAERVVHIPRTVSDAIRALSVVCFCAFLWQFAVRPTVTSPAGVIELPSQAQTLAGLPMRGSSGAPVGMIIFSDFECPSCKMFAESVMPAIAEKYVEPGHVLMAFSHLPLSEIHPSALQRATIATCAGRQGLFWSVHDRLFAGQSDVSVEEDSVAGLDLAALGGCLSSGVREDIRRAASRARELGVSATPSMFLGEVEGLRLVVTDALVGLQSVDRLSGVIDRLIRARSGESSYNSK